LSAKFQSDNASTLLYSPAKPDGYLHADIMLPLDKTLVRSSRRRLVSAQVDIDYRVATYVVF